MTTTEELLTPKMVSSYSYSVCWGAGGNITHVMRSPSLMLVNGNHDLELLSYWISKWNNFADAHYDAFCDSRTDWNIKGVARPDAEFLQELGAKIINTINAELIAAMIPQLDRLPVSLKVFLIIKRAESFIRTVECSELFACRQRLREWKKNMMMFAADQKIRDNWLEYQHALLDSYRSAMCNSKNNGANFITDQQGTTHIDEPEIGHVDYQYQAQLATSIRGIKSRIEKINASINESLNSNIIDIYMLYNYL